MKQFLLRSGWKMLFPVLYIVLLAGCDWLETSNYSHCMTAETEGNYTGEKLKNDGGVKSRVMPTAACVVEDQKLDAGDGENNGKVRWVVCLKGPDCDEAGMF